jgi:hypothetical protein
MPTKSSSCTRLPFPGGGLGLAASSIASAGACIPEYRNAQAWREIAYFLAGFNPVTAVEVTGQAQRRTVTAGCRISLRFDA